MSTKPVSPSPSAAAAAAAAASSRRFSRTKTGCFTCRARRKKCDEDRDESGACLRCRKSAIQCLGFPAIKRAPLSAERRQQRAAAGEADLRTTTTTASSSTTTTPPPSFSIAEQAIGTSLPLPAAAAAAAPTTTTANKTDEVFDDGFHNVDILELLDKPLDDLPWSLLGDDAFNPLETPPDTAHPRSFLAATPVSTSHASSFTSAAPLPALRGVSGDEDHPMTDVHTRRSSERTPSSRTSTSNTTNKQALDVLAEVFATTCTHRWYVTRETDESRRKLKAALARRLHRSEVFALSVAALVAYQHFDDRGPSLDNLSSQTSKSKEREAALLLQSRWHGLSQTLASTQIRRLTAFLDWLGSSAVSVNESGSSSPVEEFISSASHHQNLDECKSLFSLAHRVLVQVSWAAADQDQAQSQSQPLPLENGAVVHVDKYLHASMNLAWIAYRHQSARHFQKQLTTTQELLHNLLGRHLTVQLEAIHSLDAVGFRTFVWADIMNAILHCRSTVLHYRIPQRERGAEGTAEASHSTSNAVSGGEDGHELEETSQGTHSKQPLRICFGCPEELLPSLAMLANLHFQLLHAHRNGALQGQGPSSLPAWAFHQAHELQSRIQRVRSAATAASMSMSRVTTNGSSSGGNSSGHHHHPLGDMWYHAACILLHTTIYRHGPLTLDNQLHLQAILEAWKQIRTARSTTVVAWGHASMPLLCASFIASTPHDRKTCWEALTISGQADLSRESYRDFVAHLWRRSDQTGFVSLWQDVLVDYPGDGMSVM